MKRKAYMFLTGGILVVTITFILYMHLKDNDKNIEPIQEFLTILFTVEKYETLEDIILKNPDGTTDENMLEAINAMGDYHLNYKQVKDSMVEKEFNYLVSNRFITLCPKVANKFKTGTTIKDIIITPKDNNIYKFEVNLCIDQVCGTIKGEISMEKNNDEWVVTYITLNSNSLAFLFNEAVPNQ